MKLPHFHKWKKIESEAKIGVGEDGVKVGKVRIRQCEKCGALDRRSINRATREARKRYFRMRGGG